MRHWLPAALVITGLVCVNRAQAPAFTIEALPSPAGNNAQEPQFTTTGGRTILSWLDVHDDGNAMLEFAERTATGWSQPRTVAAGDDFFVNEADLPSVIRLSDGTLVGHWLQQNGDGEVYNLRLSRSTDAGTTWTPAASPHHDGTETQHGFASLFEMPGGGLGIVWLDGRATKPDADGAEFGNMSLRSASYEKSGRQLTEALIDPRVCDCCPTATALTAEGPIVAYRGRSAGEIRDVAVSRLSSGKWSAPVTVHKDGWRIDGCPVNGPSIDARVRDVVVAWFTGAGGNDGAAFVAFSHDAGRTFGPPARVDDAGTLGHVGVTLLPDGAAAVTWVAVNNQRGEFSVRRIEPNGARSARIAIGPSGGLRLPRITARGNELLFAWTESSNGRQQLRTARATLPPLRTRR
ncbi:MAG TPA: sialidase family protein [Vicinamibacterales bacterium]|jgi:hypothetical protein|nr:sialidase family protein [Vicinamibacterales bacterium]